MAYAFTSGDYEEFGVQALGRLNPGDILFMYVNQVGVKAVGEVLKHWDKETYEGNERKVDKENPEYRICVKWCTLDNPMSSADLKDTIGPPPPKAFQRIVKHHKAAEQLHLKLKRKHTQNN